MMTHADSSGQNRTCLLALLSCSKERNLSFFFIFSLFSALFGSKFFNGLPRYEESTAMYRQPSDEEPMHAADVCSAKQRARCEPDVSPPTASARSGGVWGPALVFNVQLACFYAGVVCTLSQWVIFLSFFLFRIYCLVHVSFCFLCSLVLYRFDCVVCYGYILPQAPVLLLYVIYFWTSQYAKYIHRLMPSGLRVATPFAREEISKNKSWKKKSHRGEKTGVQMSASKVQATSPVVNF